MGFSHFTNGFLADKIPIITKGESVLYKYAAGGDAMLLEYCDMLNIENQHLFDSNEELSCWVLHLETALETLESKILHVDCWMEYCLSSNIHGGGSCQEIRLVTFMFFFELLFSYVSFAISFYFSLTNLFSIILFLIC